MSKEQTKNTSEYLNEKGKFKKGNKGKPRGATNTTTRELKEFITNFLNDKAYEIPHIWNTLDDKEKANLYLHLCRLVLPKPTETENKNSQNKNSQNENSQNERTKIVFENRQLTRSEAKQFNKELEDEY
jgi:hypothetical protein